MSYQVNIQVGDEDARGLDVAALERMVTDVLDGDGVDAGAGLTLVLADDEVLRSLNRWHRDADEPTDVLSFPAAEMAAGAPAFPAPEPAPADGRDDAAPYLGDIAVSLETVRRQAPEVGLSFELELQHVVLHGLLHLLGYDHETPEEQAVMRAREEGVLGPEVHAHEASHRDE